MSRCAHSIFLSITNFSKNAAAVMEPAERLGLPRLRRSAISDFIISVNFSPSGIRHKSSAVSLEARVRAVARESEFVNNPVVESPRATMIAPVRVARSIITFGDSWVDA